MFERKSLTRITYFISSAIFALTLTLACSTVPSASPTPYQSATMPNGYGYSSIQLADNEYKVLFKATDKTSADLVQEYTLRRAAELAKKQNFSWISIVKTDVEKKPGIGKSIVRNKPSRNVKIPQDQQCTMSGCEEVAQPFIENQDDIEVRDTPMSDIYYSIIVRMSQSKPPGNAFAVNEILTNASQAKNANAG
ncbi:hypothetical protein OPS25_07090 [Alteromonas ponticola]|uniref:DUF4136 domain-containing protein n=1 Tax=Alteromonas aquimaris TaxID=2998417 RepID=A0ABT3P841_9ALTE|nr:hypothetical protein [Alteromonas aquimaris]MCW8108256.1 hypothetical protein [Alteromonas aquimaris]